MKTILLLTISNIFMTFAWYWHLKDSQEKMWKIIFLSWGIAFFEYMFMIPANRIGYRTFTAFELKTIQEIISLTVFTIFAVWYLKEELKWNYIVGFVFLILAAFFIFKKW